MPRFAAAGARSGPRNYLERRRHSLHPMRHVLLAALLLTPCLSGATDKARIAVIGDLDSLTIGQDGYCGQRTSVDPRAWKGIFVGGDERTWFGMKATVRTPMARVDCSGEFSFVPKAGTAYIVRYSLVSEGCLFELFRVVPGSDPVKEGLTREEPQVCLAK